MRNIPWNWAKFFVNKDGEIICYQHPRESIYDKIDLIEYEIHIRNESCSDENSVATEPSIKKSYV